MLDVRRIVKGVLTRYLPASAATTVGVYFLISSPSADGPFLPRMVAMTLGALACAGFTFGCVLAALSSRLDAAAPVDGRPSVVAGFVSPFAFWLSMVFIGSPTLTSGLVLAGTIGGFVALAMFFPWLARTAALPR